MALFKWLFWLLNLVLVLVVAAAAFLVFKVDPNDYKAQITQLVQDKTGHSLTLRGDIEWTFTPWLGVTLNEFSLSNRAGFLPENMLSADQAKVQVKLRPLVQKRLEIDQVLLVKPVAYLSVHADGETNWGDLTGDDQAKVSSNKREDKAQAGLLAGGLVVQGVSLSDGELHWQDEQAGQLYTLKNLNLETGALASGQPTEIDLTVVVSGSDLEAPLDVQLSSTGQLNSSMSKLNLAETKLKLKMGSKEVAGHIQKIDFDIETQQLAIADIRVDPLVMDTIHSKAGVQAASFDLGQQQLSATGIQVDEFKMDSLSVDGEVQRLHFDLNTQQLDASGVNLNHSNTELFVNGLVQKLNTPDLALNLKDETLMMPTFALMSGDLAATGSARVKGLLSDLSFTGELSSNQFSLRQQLEAMGVDLSSLSPTALNAVKLNTSLSGNLDQVNLSGLTASMDNSHIEGKASVQSFSRSSYTFNLEVDQINLDEILASSSSEKSSEVSPAVAVIALPVAGLKGLDVKGQLEVGQFTASGVQSDDVVVNVDSSADKITLSPLEAKLYQGVVTNTITYDLSSAVPQISVDSSLVDLDLGPFLNAMELTDKLEGISDMSLQLRGAGADVDQLIRSLGGKLKLSMENGAIKGANIQKSLLKAAATYNDLKGKDILADVEVGDKTEFSSFGSEFLIDQGVLSTNNIDLRAPLFRLTGRGKIDLAAQQLDLKLVAAIVESVEGQGGKALGDLRGEEVPIAVTGSVTDPHVRLDIAALLKSQLQRELERKYLDGKKVDKETAKQTAKDKLAEKLAEKLKVKLPEKASPDEKIDSKDVINQRVEQEKDKINEKLAKELEVELPEKASPDEEIKPEDILKKRLEQEKDKLKEKLFEKLFKF